MPGKSYFWCRKKRLATRVTDSRFPSYFSPESQGVWKGAGITDWWLSFFQKVIPSHAATSPSSLKQPLSSTRSPHSSSSPLPAFFPLAAGPFGAPALPVSSKISVLGLGVRTGGRGMEHGAPSSAASACLSPRRTQPASPTAASLPRFRLSSLPLNEALLASRGR